MGNIEPQSQLERIVLERLREHRWEVGEAQRHGMNLDIPVRVGGAHGVVRFRGAFAIDYGPIRPKNAFPTSPIYLRIDLGRPEGEPSRWAVWDVYDFPNGKQQMARYCAHVFHEAIGQGWASLSGCAVSPKQIWYSHYPLSTVHTLLSRAEALAPTHDEDARREQIFNLQRANFGAQSQRGKDIASVVAFSSIAALFAGLLITAAVTAPDVVMGIVASGFLGMITLGFALPAVLTLRRMLRAPRRPIEGMDAIVRTLRGTRVFSAFKMTPRKERDGLPVPVNAGGRLEVGKAPLTLSRVIATSPDHSLSLEADLCRVDWPAETSPHMRFVPDRWLTTELSGDPADLARLPQGPREERRQSPREGRTDVVVRWTFTGQELDHGAVERQFRMVATGMGLGGDAYR